MTYLSEDPTFLAGGLLLLAGAFLLALKTTQQGKYAICAGVALVLAMAVVSIEWVWVTDNERIEQVVYDLGRAVQSSDTNRVDRVLGHLMPTVQYKQGETVLSAEATRAFIQSRLSNAQFNFVRISGLQTSAGQHSRRGLAEFQVISSGSLTTPQGTVMTARTNVTAWSLGFQETGPGVWKVNRITPVEIPLDVLAMPGGPPRPADGSQLGLNDGSNVPRPNGGPFRNVRGLLPKSRNSNRLPGHPSSSMTN
jgi:hypothetical protein